MERHNFNTTEDTIYITNGLTSNERAALYNTCSPYKYINPIVFAHPEKVKKIYSKDTLILMETRNNVPFMVVPGEHLIVAINGQNQTYLRDINDSIRSNELMFFCELYNTIPLLPIPSKKIDSKESFQHVSDYYFDRYKKSVIFLNEYSKTHLIGDYFVKFAKRYLYYNYLSFLLNPLLYENVASLASEINRYKKDFPGQYLFFADSYKRAAYNYSLLLQKLSPTNSLFETVKTNFSGPTRKYVLYRVLTNEIEGELQNEAFRKQFKSFLTTYPNDTLSKILKDNYDYSLNAVKSLEKQHFYDEELLSSEGQMVSWKEILEINKGKLIYVDFWASWCLPCVREIPFSFSLAKHLNSKNIVFVYISQDEGKKNWENSVSQLNFPKLTNNYLLISPRLSKVLKYYSINAIPKYLLFDKQGNLISKDAPRPSDGNTESLLLDLINE
jgi:thiol-disulfide isomerase/thioredoxin